MIGRNRERQSSGFNLGGIGSGMPVRNAALAAALAAVLFPIGLLVSFAALSLAFESRGVIAAIPLFAGPIALWLLVAYLISHVIAGGSDSFRFWNSLSISIAIAFAPSLGSLVGIFGFLYGSEVADLIAPGLGSTSRLADLIIRSLIAIATAVLVSWVVIAIARRATGTTLRKRTLIWISIGTAAAWMLGLSTIRSVGDQVENQGPLLLLIALLIAVGSLQIYALAHMQPSRPLRNASSRAGEPTRIKAYQFTVNVLYGFARLGDRLKLGEPKGEEGEDPLRNATRRSSRLLALVGGLLLFGYVGFLAGIEFNSTQTRQAAFGSEVYVWFAAQQIPEGNQVNPLAVIKIPYPAHLLMETMLTVGEDELVGRTTRVDIPRGVPITEGMLMPIHTQIPTPILVTNGPQGDHSDLDDFTQILKYAFENGDYDALQQLMSDEFAWGFYQGEYVIISRTAALDRLRKNGLRAGSVIVVPTERAIEITEYLGTSPLHATSNLVARDTGSNGPFYTHAIIGISVEEGRYLWSEVIAYIYDEALP